MKVFKNTMHGGYCGGCLLVAAPNKEEAVKAYLKNKDLNYQWWYNGEKTPETDLENVDFTCYDLDDWEEVPKMSYDCDKPQVILEESYQE